MSSLRRRILILEDDVDLRTMLAEVLGDEGHFVEAVASGEEAVQRVSQQDYDLLVTDVRMAGLDGLEALRQARDLQPELESLVVSGYTTEAETLRALQLNVGGYLKKPFSLHDLLLRVRQILQSRQREEARRQQLSGLVQSLRWLAQESARSLASDALEAGLLAFYLARRLELPFARCRQLEMAAHLSWASIPDGLARQDRLALGPLRQLEPLEEQVLKVAAWLVNPPDEGSYPDPLDEQLRQLLDEHQWDLSEAARLVATQALEDEQRSAVLPLLGLAQTLEARQLWQEAALAYQRLRQHSQDGSLLRQRALVGEARCGWKAGSEGWYEQLKEAEQQHRRLSLRASLRARWSIARLLLESAHTSARAYLKQLEHDSRSQGEPELWALARLAGDPDESSAEAARYVLDPSRRFLLEEEADWLIGALWRVAPDLGPAAPWCSLAGEFPGHSARALQSETAGLEVLLSSWEAAPHLISPTLLEALGEKAARCRPLHSGGVPRVYLRIHCFGALEIFLNGSRLDDRRFKTQKARFVLAYLALRQGPVSEDELVEEFWPEARDAGKSSVYAATTSIRRALRQDDSRPGELLLREGSMLRLDSQLEVWCDARELEKHWALPQRDSLLSLYRGPFLQGCYLDWAVRLRHQWEERMLQALQELAARQLELEPRQTLETAGQGLDIDPLRQELHALKIRAYLALGQPEAGLRQFQLCEKLLRQELGLEPLTSLLELYHRCRLAL